MEIGGETLIARVLGAMLGAVLATAGAGIGALVGGYWLNAPAIAVVLASLGALFGGLTGATVALVMPRPQSAADRALDDLTHGRALADDGRLAPLLALQEQAQSATAREAVLMSEVKEAVLTAHKAEAKSHTARQKASQAQAVRNAFLTRMSHELRTPLNAMIGYAEMVAEEVDDDSLRADLQKVRRAGLHLKGLVTTVLDLSQLESGKYAVHPESIDLGALVHEIVEGATNEAETNQDTFDIQVKAGTTTIADKRMLQSIVFNLLHNAVKYTKNGTISIQATVDTHLTLRIADTGIGMTPRQMQQAFEPFQQADVSTTRKYDGAGLGLAICRSFAEAMGGGIAIESEPGKGAAVILTLPRLVTAVEPEEDEPDEPTMLLR